MLMKPTYKFSIISAVYNTAEYLREMIESVIRQDIGFEENVQLILVNDGSTDDSEDICLQYQEKYPDNIIYFKNPHLGVSEARNTGLAYAQGKYINFLDSDDKLDILAMRKVYNFFEENYDQIDLVAIPLHFFDKEQGEHILNYKFIANKVIDIKSEFTKIQLSASSSFIKNEIIKQHRFNTNLKYAEDAEIITKIILQKGRYGVSSEARYYYRRRQDNSSTIQRNNIKEWYIDYIKEFSINMLKLAKDYPDYTDYIGYLVLYDLQWRINRMRYIKYVLDEQDYEEYMRIFTYIIKKVNLQSLLEQKQISKKRKSILVGIRYSKYQWLSESLLAVLCK